MLGNADRADMMDVDVVQSIEPATRSDSLSEAGGEAPAQDQDQKTADVDQSQNGSSLLRREEKTKGTGEVTQAHDPHTATEPRGTAAQPAHALPDTMAPPPVLTGDADQNAAGQKPADEHSQDASPKSSSSSSSSDRKRGRTTTPMPESSSPQPKKQKKKHRRRTNPAYYTPPTSSLPPWKYISPRQNNEFVRTPSAMSHRAYTPFRAATPALSRTSTPAQHDENCDDEPNSDLFTESPRHSVTTYTSMALEYQRVVPSETAGQIRREPKSGHYLYNGLEEIRQQVRKMVARANEAHEEVEERLEELKRQGGGGSQIPLYKLAGVMHSEMALDATSKGPHLNET